MKETKRLRKSSRDYVFSKNLYFVYIVCLSIYLSGPLFMPAGYKKIYRKETKQTHCKTDIKVRFIFISFGCQCAGNWEIRKYYTRFWLVNAHLNANTHAHWYTSTHDCNLCVCVHEYCMLCLLSTTFPIYFTMFDLILWSCFYATFTQ